VPATPVVSQPYTHIGYFDIKVKLERSDDPWDKLIGATKDIFIQLWKMDLSIKIFVYKKSECIKDPSYIANASDSRKVNFFCFDKYFFWGAPLPLGGSRTLNVLMTYTVDFNTIMKQIGPIMTGMKCGVYMRTLQAEKSTTIGWTYMTTENTNKLTLAEAITQKIRIPIGLQWRVITTGMAGGDIKEEDKVRAIHFEVEDCNIQYAKRTLNDLYHHSQTDGFPLEMKLRFMPLFAKT
jgi:aryl-phospho-beta-D-glucosidase BglC (GH1 family)